MAEAVPPLNYEQTARVLKKLANLKHSIVLVGGQAVNFWADFYENAAPRLAHHAPFISRDIDFIDRHTTTRSRSDARVTPVYNQRRAVSASNRRDSSNRTTLPHWLPWAL